jgi:DNA segregation ATPase FtsK/SpoIIIE, S-DNA-T family
VVTEWAGPASLGELLHAAGLPIEGPHQSVWVDGIVHGTSDLIDQVWLRDGSTISATSRSDEDHRRADTARDLHIAVTAGPAAGTMQALPRGATYLGTDPECELVLSDATVAGRQAVIHSQPDGGLWLEDLGAGTTLDRAPVSTMTPLAPGQSIGVGRALLEVRPGQSADAVVDPVDNFFEVRRPPRIRQPQADVDVAWPPEPSPPTRQPIPWAASLAPIAMGAVLYLVTKQVLTILFVGLTPIMTAINVVSSRRGGRSFYRQAMVAHGLAVAAATAQLEAALDQERQLRLQAAQDAASMGATAAGPRRALWERRRGDDDFLHLRLGLATLPAQVRQVTASIHGHEPMPPLHLSGVPAVLALTDIGVLGVAGPPEFTRSAASWLVAQAAVSSGPSDLQIMVLAAESPDDEARWAWAQWLPHTLPGQPGGSPLFGTTRETVDARISELVELIQGRDDPAQLRQLRRVDWPRVLVVIDPAYDIRRVPGMDYVLRHGPEVGVLAICVEGAENYLPPECKATLILGQDGSATLAVSERPVLAEILPDTVTPSWCRTLARNLAACRDPETIAAGGTIPSVTRLVDLLGLDRLDPSAVQAGWAAGHRSTSAVIGVGVDGPFRVDLRLDGPHGLVGGTTGAGKSEFLQTLIAALAVANRHDALNFLLVDYKGGSAFRDCSRLPHTVGVVTDLDGHLTRRALESLSAELKRREELLARGGAKDIDDYITMGEPVGALPRLLIVIDEFAGLVAELPDFVTGLVGIAQRGRSLGIHMILATQRPSGVISPEIRANTNLRVALRVTSPAESADIIDAPDAARIMPATPGRAYARTGHSALTPFQSARVGGPATPAATEQGPQVAAARAGWAEAGDAPVPPTVGTSGQVDPTDTDLARLATVLTEAAEQSGVARQPRPWLPALPAVLLLEDLGRPRPTADELTPAPFAVVDLPAAQQQQVVAYHPADARHLAIAGGPGSGRTTVLRTLAISVARLNRPEDVWLYAIDCGGGELRRLGQLPHTGAVVTRTEIDRTDRLLTRLHQEMNRRLEQLASDGYTDVTEQRANVEPDQRIPYVVVLIDRWEGFMTTFDTVDNQRLTDLVIDLAREGGGAGIRLVITGDRSLLIGRLATAIDDRLCLNLPDRSDYSFAGFDIRKIPDPMVPGRAVRSSDIAEMHIAVAGADPSGASQAAAIGALVQSWRDDRAAASGIGLPFRIATLPADIDDFAALEFLSAPPTPHTALLAVGGDELSAITTDILRSGGFVVAGPRRSGRSNALLVMARSLLANKCQVVAFCPRPSLLRSLRGQPGVAGIFDGDDPPMAQVLDTLNQLSGPLAVLVDDASVLSPAPIAELLGHVAAEGVEQGHALVVAGIAEELMRPMRGFIYQTVQSRAGLLLCPEHATDGDLLGAHLPRSAVFRHPPGRAILIGRGRTQTVQVPLAAGVEPG